MSPWAVRRAGGTQGTWSAPWPPRGPEAFAAAATAMLDDAHGWRLAEMRKRRGLTQEQVAARMGISVARVLQIEAGHVSTKTP